MVSILQLVPLVFGLEHPLGDPEGERRLVNRQRNRDEEAKGGEHLVLR
jgi:hypothetical protein